MLRRFGLDTERATCVSTLPYRRRSRRRSSGSTSVRRTDQLAGPAATMAWSDEPFTGGGYAGYEPNQLAAFWEPLRAGTDRIHFAVSTSKRSPATWRARCEAALVSRPASARRPRIRLELHISR
jgi:hypothetical protein